MPPSGEGIKIGILTHEKNHLAKNHPAFLIFIWINLHFSYRVLMKNTNKIRIIFFYGLRGRPRPLRRRIDLNVRGMRWCLCPKNSPTVLVVDKIFETLNEGRRGAT